MERVVHIAAPIVGVVTVRTKNKEEYSRLIEEIRRATLDY
jgi:hypothetical protein